ncbi:MAG: SDR family oxidoreductase [Neptuniibacter sp.]
MNKVLVLGASGATGQRLVELLLKKGVEVIAVVRNNSTLNRLNQAHSGLQILERDINTMAESELAEQIKKCDAVLSCLGHNLTFKGIFGQPRRLVTDAMKKVVGAMRSAAPDKHFKIILMNTTGNSNQDIPEQPPWSQRIVVSLLRCLIPPHLDNELAADFLRVHVGQNSTIEWVAVRPDGLINEDSVSEYEIMETPVRNVIFDAGKTSRINVADFMSDLAIKSELWNKWKGRMPVIYNKT